MGQDNRSRRSRLRTRAGAASLALLLHVAFVLAVLATASGTLPRGATDPFGEGEAISVSLAGREGADGGAQGAVSREQPTKIDRMDQMARRVRAEQSDLFVSETEPSRPRGGLSALFRSIGHLSTPGRQGDGAQRAGRGEERGQAADTARASRAGVPDEDEGSQGLWGQVEPCWRKLKAGATVPVTLEVVLNDQGRLAAPPRILRPQGGRPEEARLVAEAQALAAIQACLPYKGVGGGGFGRAYRLRFREQ